MRIRSDGLRNDQRSERQGGNLCFVELKGGIGLIFSKLDRTDKEIMIYEWCFLSGLPRRSLLCLQTELYCYEIRYPLTPKFTRIYYPGQVYQGLLVGNEGNLALRSTLSSCVVNPGKYLNFESSLQQLSSRANICKSSAVTLVTARPCRKLQHHRRPPHSANTTLHALHSQNLDLL